MGRVFFSPTIMGYVTVMSDKESMFPYYSIPSHCELVVMECRVEEAMTRTKPKEPVGEHRSFISTRPCSARRSRAIESAVARL
jgi:hypothetical protein